MSEVVKFVGREVPEGLDEKTSKGFFSRGITEGRRRQKLDQSQDAIKAAAMLAGVKEAHAAEIARLDERWRREEQKHGSAKFWAGMFTGAMCAAAIAAAGTAVVVNMVIGPTFDAAARSRMDSMAVGVMTMENPPEPRRQEEPQ